MQVHHSSITYRYDYPTCCWFQIIVVVEIDYVVVNLTIITENEYSYKLMWLKLYPHKELIPVFGNHTNYMNLGLYL